MNKKVLYGLEAREKLLSGIDKIADAVSVTLGPMGRNVLKGNSDTRDYATVSFPNSVTKDGYKVTTWFDSDDFFEKAGIMAVKECAFRSVFQSGDGTTTTVVLMRHLVKEGMKAIEAKVNPMQLKRDIDAAVGRVVEALKFVAIQIGEDNEKILQIATISANNDLEMGGLVASAFKQIGREGSIDIEPAKGITTEIKIAKGYRLESGWLDPLFVNNKARMTVEFQEPYILLYNKVITHHTQVMKAMEVIVQDNRNREPKRPVVIICAGAQDEGFAFLALNSQGRVDKNGNYIPPKFECCIVRLPMAGGAQEMEDLAILTGATFMADNRGYDIKEIKLEHLGSAKKVIITREETTIVEGESKRHSLENLLSELRANRENAKNEDEAAPIEKRIAKLTGGVAVIQVGAATETEQKEKMDRFDDSVRAVKSAIAEGYTAGAGTALLRIDSGNEILNSAMAMVLKQICANAGEDTVFDKVKGACGNIGYNAKTGKIEDLIEAGVIDPIKVLRCAVQNAASSATMILTTECAIVDSY